MDGVVYIRKSSHLSIKKPRKAGQKTLYIHAYMGAKDDETMTML